MTWVRYDDNVRNHPKVEPLDDATYRLWREAIEWASQNQTDGVILARQLALTSTRATARRAAKLVQAGLWHTAAGACLGARCPPPGPDGWVIHDYWDYQPTRHKVRDEQSAAAERKRRWMDRKRNGVGNGVPNGVGNGVPNGGRNAVKNAYPAPSHPAPKGRGGAAPHHSAPAAGSGGAAADAEITNPRAAARPKCPKHRGQPARNCAICRSEDLGGIDG